MAWNHFIHTYLLEKATGDTEVCLLLEFVASELSTPVVDVDGSYLYYRNQKQLSSASITITTTPDSLPDGSL